MAQKLVKVVVDLHGLVKLVVDPDFTVRPPKEHHEQQWVQKHRCYLEVDKNDWDWRWATAIEILCAGESDTTGSYYGDVIGGEWIIDEIPQR